MNIGIITEYPLWFLIFCIIVGAVFAFGLYYRDRKNEFSKSLTGFLAILRFLAIFIIAFLLLGPLFKTEYKTSEKPLILIAQDNSESIGMGLDSADMQSYYSELRQLSDELGENYDVREFSFDAEVDNGIEEKPIGKQTDLANVFSEFRARFDERNVGAIILSSDGLFNKGLNPLYAAKNLGFPVYTIAMGDTNIRKDVILSKINFNRIAYLGNEFPVEIIVNSFNASGSNVRARLMSGNKELGSKTISVTSNQYSETVRFSIEAEETGLKRYRVVLSGPDDEISKANNSRDFFVDILDARQKILILANSPHPDIAALKKAIESNYNYEVEERLAKNFTESLKAYNLVILHQLPSIKHKIEDLTREIRDSGLPVLFIIGGQTNLSLFHKLDAGLEINKNKGSLDETLPAINNEFPLFTISEVTRRRVNVFSPLLSPFGEYNLVTSASVLFYQRIGSISTNKPLIAFVQHPEYKVGFITGEGIWRWPLAEYAVNNDHQGFQEIINKIIQYLSVKVDKSFFRVYSKNSFMENEDVVFDAEVYNESYELINEPDVRISIVNSSGKEYPFVFDRTANAYFLNAGTFPVDNYSYQATVRWSDKLLTENGEFAVSPVNIETQRTRADHNLLMNISRQSNGDMFYPDQLSALSAALQEREDIKTVTYTEKRYNSLLNFFWIFVVIVALLSTEWLLRKRSGAY